MESMQRKFRKLQAEVWNQPMFDEYDPNISQLDAPQVPIEQLLYFLTGSSWPFQNFVHQNQAHPVLNKVG